MCSKANHRQQSCRGAPPRAAPVVGSKAVRVYRMAPAPGALPPAQALTSAARTAWFRRLPRATQCLRDLLEMRAQGRGLSVPWCALRHPRPQPALRPRLTCTRLSGKSPQWPPNSPRNQPRAGPLHTCWITSPGAKLSSPSFCARYPARTSTSVDGNATQKGPVGQRKSRVVVYRFLLPFPHVCVEEPPQTLCTYPWLAGRPPEPDREGSAIQPAAEYWAGVGWDELRV